MKTMEVQYGGTTFRIGDEVRVKGHKTVAKIECFYEYIPGGVSLNCTIGDFHSWNVSDLVKVRAIERRTL